MIIRAQQQRAHRIGQVGIIGVGIHARVFHAAALQREQKLHIAPLEAIFDLRIESGRRAQPPCFAALLFIIGRNRRFLQPVRADFGIIAVFRAERILQRGKQRIARKLRYEIAQIAYAAAHALYALGLQLAGIDVQIILQTGKIGAHQQRAVVLAHRAARAECVSGKLAPVRQQIVSAGKFARNAQRTHRAQDHVHLSVQIVSVFARDERKIQIARIVEYRAAAGDSAHQLHMIALHGG